MMLPKGNISRTPALCSNNDFETLYTAVDRGEVESVKTQMKSILLMACRRDSAVSVSHSTNNEHPTIQTVSANYENNRENTHASHIWTCDTDNSTHAHPTKCPGIASFQRPKDGHTILTFAATRGNAEVLGAILEAMPCTCCCPLLIHVLQKEDGSHREENPCEEDASNQQFLVEPNAASLSSSLSLCPRHTLLGTTMSPQHCTSAVQLPLHIVSRGNTAALRLLLSYYYCQDSDHSPHFLPRGGACSPSRGIPRHQCVPNSSHLLSALLLRDRNGDRCLHIAAKRGRLAIVKLLVEAEENCRSICCPRAEINGGEEEDEEDGDGKVSNDGGEEEDEEEVHTVLGLASANGHLDVVTYLAAYTTQQRQCRSDHREHEGDGHPHPPRVVAKGPVEEGAEKRHDATPPRPMKEEEIQEHHRFPTHNGGSLRRTFPLLSAISGGHIHVARALVENFGAAVCGADSDKIDDDDDDDLSSALVAVRGTNTDRPSGRNHHSAATLHRNPLKDDMGRGPLHCVFSHAGSSNNTRPIAEGVERLLGMATTGPDVGVRSPADRSRLPPTHFGNVMTTRPTGSGARSGNDDDDDDMNQNANHDELLVSDVTTTRLHINWRRGNLVNFTMLKTSSTSTGDAFASFSPQNIARPTATDVQRALVEMAEGANQRTAADRDYCWVHGTPRSESGSGLLSSLSPFLFPIKDSDTSDEAARLVVAKVRTQYCEVLQLLLDNGADVDDEEGWRLGRGNVEPADSRQRQGHHHGRNGWTALHYVAEECGHGIKSLMGLAAAQSTTNARSLHSPSTTLHEEGEQGECAPSSVCFLLLDGDATARSDGAAPLPASHSSDEEGGEREDGAAVIGAGLFGWDDDDAEADTNELPNIDRRATGQSNTYPVDPRSGTRERPPLSHQIGVERFGVASALAAVLLEPIRLLRAHGAATRNRYNAATEDPNNASPHHPTSTHHCCPAPSAVDVFLKAVRGSPEGNGQSSSLPAVKRAADAGRHGDNRTPQLFVPSPRANNGPWQRNSDESLALFDIIDLVVRMLS